MTGEKLTLDELISHFKLLAETYEMCAHATCDDLRREWYQGKYEAYRTAAFELECNLK